MAIIQHNYPQSEHVGPIPIGSQFTDSRSAFKQPMLQQPPVTGVESLMDFQDNMNSKSGLERLRALQTLGLMSLANDTYMEEEEQPRPMTGMQSLPQIQAGFGGFLKNIVRAVTRPFKAVAKGISKFAKSKLGKMIVPAALAFAAPWAMGLSFSSSPFLYSAMAGLGSGVGSLVTGAKPGDALRNAFIGGLATYAGGSLFSKFGSGAGVGGTSGGLTNTSKLVGTGAARSVGGGGPSLGTFGQFGGPGAQTFGTLGTGPGAINAANIASAVTPATITGGNPLLAAMNQQTAVQQALTKAGLPMIDQSVQPAFSGIQFTGGGSATAPLASVQPGAQSIFSGDTSMEAFKNLPRQAFDRLTKTPEGWGAIGRDMVPSGEETAIKELEDYGFTESPSSFGTQTAYYVNPDTGQEMSISDAIAYMRSKSQGITDTQRLEQATQQGGYGYLAPQLKYRKDGGALLRNNGGLMGYAYGGQLPEFSGQVPGEGHGMEDNISFPVTERQGGGNVQIAEGRLSPDEYVVDAYTVAALGNGSSDAGAKVLDNAVKNIRQQAYGNRQQPNELNQSTALQTLIKDI